MQSEVCLLERKRCDTTEGGIARKESKVAISQVLVAASRSGKIFPWNPGKEYGPANASHSTL